MKYYYVVSDNYELSYARSSNRSTRVASRLISDCEPVRAFGRIERAAVENAADESRARTKRYERTRAATCRVTCYNATNCCATVEFFLLISLMGITKISTGTAQTYTNILLNSIN